MIERNNISDGDVSFLKAANSWVEMYGLVNKMKLRYRATELDSNREFNKVDNIIHSLIEKICYK